MQPPPHPRGATRRAAKDPAPWRVGVDTGGTFTDFVCLTSNGLRVHKRRSTPDDPSKAILDGIRELAPDQGPAEVIHGSTVATNAVLERKGARVAVIATAGFADVLRIGRQTRPELYNIFVPPRRPIVAPELTFSAPGRLDFEGREIEPLDFAIIDQLAEQLRCLEVEIVAVCFLHSYASPRHEADVTQRLRRAGLRVCASHEALPEYREFERWSTTVVNAYVTPIIDRYLGRLESELLAPRLRVMQSNGGSLSAAAARAQAVRTVLSGPAGGAVGASSVAHAAGFPRIISFDMGGTSTDVSLMDGSVSLTTESVVGDFPVRLPMIDIHTVGAGGGSIATVDSGGALRVGPQSAGANPGPACYGAGSHFTVTDANLLLGRLDGNDFFGGRLKLDASRAKTAAEPLAKQLKLTVLELAEGVVRVANANMERAIRVVSVERGHDPREFTLLAFGGAGGMHACEIAAQLEIGTIVVPRYAGVLSALGMLLADVTKDYSASVLQRSDALSATEIARLFKPLTEAASRDLCAEGFARARQRIERLVDVRYAGQSYELTIPFTLDFRREFDRRHAARYGYASPDRPTEIVNLRVRAAGLTEKPLWPRARLRVERARPAESRPANFDSRSVATSFYRWPDLRPGAHAVGPAVITGPEATTVVPPGFKFRIDRMKNVVIQPR